MQACIHECKICYALWFFHTIYFNGQICINLRRISMYYRDNVELTEQRRCIYINGKPLKQLKLVLVSSNSVPLTSVTHYITRFHKVLIYSEICLLIVNREKESYYTIIKEFYDSALFLMIFSNKFRIGLTTTKITKK